MLQMFSDDKSTLVDFVEQCYVYMLNKGDPIQIIRVDSAGENIAVRKFLKEKGVTVEMTVPSEPRLKSVVEHAFAIR